MTTQLTINPARTAVLSMDLQKGIVSVYVKDQEGAKGQEGMLGRAASVLKWARSVGMCVIHVQVEFRPNLPEIGASNPLFRPIKASPRHRKLFEGELGAIHPAVAPKGDDIIVTKHRVSAFAGTDLDMILRAKGIDTLVMFGIATSGVVLSTALQAGDADYRVIVINDCCADLDAEVHGCLVEKVFPRQAKVVTASEFLEAVVSGDATT